MDGGERKRESLAPELRWLEGYETSFLRSFFLMERLKQRTEGEL